MKKSEYICDICGAKTTTDEIINEKTTKTKLYGLYYTSDTKRWVKHPIYNSEHHICFDCIQAICRIAKEEKII